MPFYELCEIDRTFAVTLKYNSPACLSEIIFIMPAGVARGCFHRKYEFDYSRCGENLKYKIALRFTTLSIMDTLPSKFCNRYRASPHRRI